MCIQTINTYVTITLHPLRTIFVQIFCKTIINLKVIIKSIKGPDDNFKGTLSKNEFSTLFMCIRANDTLHLLNVALLLPSFRVTHQPINTLIGQKQPDNFDDIFQMKGEPAVMAEQSKAPPLTARYFLPLPGFESRPRHVRKLPVTLGLGGGLRRVLWFPLLLTTGYPRIIWHKCDEKQNSHSIPTQMKGKLGEYLKVNLTNTI